MDFEPAFRIDRRCPVPEPRIRALSRPVGGAWSLLLMAIEVFVEIKRKKASKKKQTKRRIRKKHMPNNGICFLLTFPLLGSGAQGRPESFGLVLFSAVRKRQNQKIPAFFGRDFCVCTTRHISRVLFQTAIFLVPSSPRGSSHLDEARRASGISSLRCCFG